MKIIAVIGSKRKGNSYFMVQSVKDTVQKLGVEIEIVHLRELTFGFCDGCLSCDETGICHLNDDMLPLVEKLREADGIILASPARWSLLSGEMKVFMDRLNPLASVEALAGKKAVVFTVGQTTQEDKSILTAAESMESFCENAGIEVVSKVLAYDCLMEGEVNEQVIAKCINAARCLVDSLR